jgi:hypothetical protein
MAGKALMSAMNTSEATDNPIKTMIANSKRRRNVLRSGGGKYSMPVRYAVRKAGGKIKRAIGDFIGGIKDKRGKMRQMEDASGKTSRNSSATCGPKGCGKIGGKE